MKGNRYQGVVETWVPGLIVHRAKLLGFTEDELADLQQEIILDVLAFEYDPARSNGATLRTVLTALIDRRLRAIQRKKQRYQKHLDHLKAAYRDEPSVEEPVPLVMDVREALSRMTEEDRRICQALTNGDNLSHIAQRWGCGWHTLNRRLQRISERLLSLNLDSWLR